jgi:hypothetical protein
MTNQKVSEQLISLVEENNYYETKRFLERNTSLNIFEILEEIKL